MDFSEAADDAAFRARARKWLEANAKPVDEGTVHLLGHADPDEELRHVQDSQRWQATLADAGWAGIAWPVEHGGQGGTARQQAIFDEEQMAFDVPQSVFAQGIGMAGPTLIAHGTDAQKDRFLRPMLRGEEIWCQLFSEPGAGSDLASLSARAELDGDEYVVNGQKVWTSSAHFSHWGILLARTNPDAPKHQGITYFLVDMRTPGIEVRPLRQISGVAHFNEVFLTDVRIPAENVVGDVDRGWGVTMTTLGSERSMIGGGRAGDPVQDLIDVATATGAVADTRCRQRLMRAYTSSRILQFLGWRAQTTALKGAPPGPESSVIKLAHSVHQEEIGDLGVGLLGAAGTLLDYDALEDHPWASRFLTQWASRIGGGTEQVQRNILGERVLGLPGEPRLDKDVPFRDLPRN